jgi:hypothetical protein
VQHLQIHDLNRAAPMLLDAPERATDGGLLLSAALNIQP